MPLPNIAITFQTLVSTAFSRSQKGTVAVIVLDAAVAAQGSHVLTLPSQIPAALTETNQAYIADAFIGYTNTPKKILLYVLAAEAANLTVALAWMALQSFDYLVGPPDCTVAFATEIAAWITVQRAADRTYKAVLPGKAADNEAIVNFTTAGIVVGSNTYAAAGYCARIAGLIAGTPMTISCTYAPLPEVSDVTRLTKAAIDAAIDAGEFVLFYDGEKVKVGRAVNSYTTTAASKGAVYKKIKLVETLDMIRNDIRTVLQDVYIGKYANSYDNKCVLITAIQNYLTGLEGEGILQAGSTVALDVNAQISYLESQSIDTSEMTEQEIKEANTADKVFLMATIKPLDVIEDVTLAITL